MFFYVFIMAGWEHGRELPGVNAFSLLVFPLKPGLMFLFGGLLRSSGFHLSRFANSTGRSPGFVISMQGFL